MVQTDAYNNTQLIVHLISVRVYAVMDAMFVCFVPAVNKHNLPATL
jgi:hypothetical protein